MNSRLNFAPIKRTKRIKTDFSSISLAAHDTALPDPLLIAVFAIKLDESMTDPETHPLKIFCQSR